MAEIIDERTFYYSKLLHVNVFFSVSYFNGVMHVFDES